jgi:TPP-dependent pyruvate/acetoin dehydrogenase alpha subunit
MSKSKSKASGIRRVQVDEQELEAIYQAFTLARIHARDASESEYLNKYFAKWDKLFWGE